MSHTRNVLEESFETHSVEDVQKMEETTEEVSLPMISVTMTSEVRGSGLITRFLECNRRILFKEFDIPQDDLKSIGVDIINEIGSGTYAKVYKGV